MRSTICDTTKCFIYHIYVLHKLWNVLSGNCGGPYFVEKQHPAILSLAITTLNEMAQHYCIKYFHLLIDGQIGKDSHRLGIIGKLSFQIMTSMDTFADIRFQLKPKVTLLCFLQSCSYICKNEKLILMFFSHD